MYGQQPNNGMYEAALARLNSTKPIKPPSSMDRDPFIGDGQHVLMLVAIEPFLSQTHGPSARGIFEVVQSTCHPVGSRVAKLWFLSRPAPKPGMNDDADQFADFLRKMIGAQQEYQPSAEARAVLTERVQDQVLRGMLIQCVGKNNQKGTYVNVMWFHVPQQQDQIRQQRASLEQRIAAKAAAQPAAQPQAQQWAQPAPQQPTYSQQASAYSQQASAFANFGAQAPAPQQWAQPAPQQAAPAWQLQPGAPGATQTAAPMPQQWAPQVQPAAQPMPGGGFLAQIPGFNR